MAPWSCAASRGNSSAPTLRNVGRPGPARTVAAKIPCPIRGPGSPAVAHLPRARGPGKSDGSIQPFLLETTQAFLLETSTDNRAPRGPRSAGRLSAEPVPEDIVAGCPTAWARLTRQSASRLD